MIERDTKHESHGFDCIEEAQVLGEEDDLNKTEENEAEPYMNILITGFITQLL